MQPLELDEGGVAGGTAGHRHGPTSLPPRLRVKRRSWAAPAGRPRVTMTAMRPLALPIALVLSAGLAAVAPTAAQTRRAAAAAAPRVYTATLPVEQMRHKQAVVTTSLGDIVIELLPDAAPDHVGYLMKLAQEHAYDGTTFHRAILRGLIQGGDPLSKDPAKKARYGTGGLGVLKFRANAHDVRGAVSAVLRPGQPDSAGAQFFVCVSDQPALDGRYTVFGRVVEGLEIAQRFRRCRPTPRARGRSRRDCTVTIRDTPPAEPTPFATETAAELAHTAPSSRRRGARSRSRSSPDQAPEHVRNFLRLAHRRRVRRHGVPPCRPGFVVQTGTVSTHARR